MKLEGFAPVADQHARVLILGSMPGVESLRRAQYYGHPRNSFWWILGELTGIGPELDYEQRIEQLRGQGIALWDVLKHCQRAGSLDSAIDRSTEEPNDFGLFIDQHQELGCLFFNGRKAFDTYTRRVLPQLRGRAQALPRILLPSTSPAHASLARAEKLSHWQVVAERLRS